MPVAASAAGVRDALPPLSERVWCQFSHECRRQRVLLAIVWAATLILALRDSQWPSPQLHSFNVAALFWLSISVLHYGAIMALPWWMAGRCFWASRVAGLNLSIHSRPVGRAALWLAQLCFLAVAVIIPRMLSTLIGVIGFGYSASMLAWAMIGSLVFSLAVIGAIASLVSLSATKRQLTLWVTLAVVVSVAWFTLASLAIEWLDRFGSWTGKQGEQDICSMWALFFSLAIGLCTAWVWHVTTRHRRSAALLVAATVGVLPIVHGLWQWDWLSPHPQPYTSSTLQVVTAEAGKPLPPQAESLWRNLGVTGLPVNATAVVTQFAPIPDNASGDWTWVGYRDSESLANNSSFAVEGPSRRGVETDLIRALVRRDPNWSWQDTEDSSRPPVAEIWRREQASPSFPGTPGKVWRLGLQVYEPRLVLDLPLRELLARSHDITLAPGLRMHLARYLNDRREPSFIATGEHRWPGLMRRTSRNGGSHTSGSGLGHPVSWCAFVVLDDAHRVAQVDVDTDILHQEIGVATFGRGWSHGFTIKPPELRMQLTGLSLEKWMDQVRVQVWWPEPRGSTHVDVPSTEVARLAQPQ
ncbi:hypothetical protein AYO49_01460 [Verrucomicrobiaceae bacterium SCGC AG-212-N21]|nr:hypothetical protein AYO49_01460 [Verrucomicrobiaceae bacterium SCGC AG-212-N21]